MNGNSVSLSNGTATPVPTIESTSASPVKREASSDELSDLEDDAPPKKKAKKSKPVKDEDDDAAYAAKLQAQLNNSARPTRGGGARPAKTSKATPKKKAPKKKSSAKISAADDSDVESGGEDEKTTERGGAFNVRASQLLGFRIACDANLGAETNVAIRAAQGSTRRGTALATQDRQRHMGLCQKERDAEPGRQAADTVRRRLTGHLQAGHYTHVYNGRLRV